MDHSNISQENGNCGLRMTWQVTCAVLDSAEKLCDCARPPSIMVSCQDRTSRSSKPKDGSESRSRTQACRDDTEAASVHRTLGRVQEASGQRLMAFATPISPTCSFRKASKDNNEAGLLPMLWPGGARCSQTKDLFIFSPPSIQCILFKGWKDTIGDGFTLRKEPSVQHEHQPEECPCHSILFSSTASVERR